MDENFPDVPKIAMVMGFIYKKLFFLPLLKFKDLENLLFFKQQIKVEKLYLKNSFNHFHAKVTEL